VKRARSRDLKRSFPCQALPIVRQRQGETEAGSTDLATNTWLPDLSPHGSVLPCLALSQRDGIPHALHPKLVAGRPGCPSHRAIELPGRAHPGLLDSVDFRCAGGRPRGHREPPEPCWACSHSSSRAANSWREPAWTAWMNLRSSSVNSKARRSVWRFPSSNSAQNCESVSAVPTRIWSAACDMSQPLAPPAVRSAIVWDQRPDY
jgi:hypothetical protein